MSEQVTIKVDAEQLARVKALAKDHGVKFEVSIVAASAKETAKD